MAVVSHLGHITLVLSHVGLYPASNHRTIDILAELLAKMSEVSLLNPRAPTTSSGGWSPGEHTHMITHLKPPGLQTFDVSADVSPSRIDPSTDQEAKLGGLEPCGSKLIPKRIPRRSYHSPKTIHPIHKTIAPS